MTLASVLFRSVFYVFEEIAEKMIFKMVALLGGKKGASV